MSRTGGNGGSDVGPEPVSGREKQRSRTGCQTCRSRKVKCDETPGGCQNCERLSLPCPSSPAFLSATAAAADENVDVDAAVRTEAGHGRIRVFRSCNACRSSKTRCSADKPACARCRQRSLACVYEGKRSPAWMNSGLGDRHSEHQRSVASTSPFAGGERSTSPAALENRPGISPTRLSGGKAVESGGLNWLTSPDLPSRERVGLLVEEYFTNIHGLRSFGFIHKPTFLQQLDERMETGKRKDILLYAVCALGAKFVALRSADSANLSRFALAAGSQWADRARYILFTNMNKVSTEMTMALVLLHEHDLRVGNYAAAFAVTGLAVRMAQALQINIESSSDILCLEVDGLSASCRESRRRLMWAVYVMDAWVGGGADDLTLIADQNMKIQLPCNERNFVFQIPCIVETLQPGKQLPFITPEAQAQGPVDSIDLQAQFIRLISLRKRVLRYIKHLEKAPWHAASEFASLESSLVQWHTNLPPSLRFTPSAISLRKEFSQLGGLLFLHITYHQSLIDLNRIGMTDLSNTRDTVENPLDKNDFLLRVQDQCLHHATAIVSVYWEALQHGPETLVDTWLTVVAHDTAHILIQYTANGLGTLRDRMPRQAVSRPLHTLLYALKRMAANHFLARPLHLSVLRMCRSSGLSMAADTNLAPASEGAPVSEAERALLPLPQIQDSPPCDLFSLSIYSMARKDISAGEKHTPEESPTYSTLPATAIPLSSGIPAILPYPSTLPPPLLPGSSLQGDTPQFLGNSELTVVGFPFTQGFDAQPPYLPHVMGGISLPGAKGLDNAAALAARSGSAGFSVPVESVYPLLPEPNCNLDVQVTPSPAAGR